MKPSVLPRIRAVLRSHAPALLLSLPLLTAASFPTWWTSREVITSGAPSNDYAPAAQGQVKHIAARARDEMDAILPGGAGAEISAVVQSFGPGGFNDAPVTLGQLKSLAQPFYDRLIAAGVTKAYPWTFWEDDDNDLAPANIGQVKNVFSFELDADRDGLGDWWEREHSGSLALNPGDDPDGDSLINFHEFQLGSSPVRRDTDGDGLLDNEELAAHCSPLTADSDGDGMGDGWEVRYSLDPANPNDALGDRDTDGLFDAQEFALGTSPMDYDSDDDGLPDDWESRYGLDPASGLRDLAGWWRFDSPGIWQTNVVTGSITNTMVKAIYEWDSGPYGLHAILQPAAASPQPFPLSVTNSIIAGVPTPGSPEGPSQCAWRATSLTTNPVLSIPAHATLAGSSNGWSAAFRFSHTFGFATEPLDILRFSDTNAAPFRVQLDTSRRLVVTLTLVGTNAVPSRATLQSPSPLPEDFWNFIGITHDAASGISSLYVQSNLVASVTNSYSGNSALRTSHSALVLLPQSDARSPKFDDLRIHRCALSPAEIARIFSPSDPGDDPDGDGLPNWRELSAYSSPLTADTDQDGLTDSNEFFNTRTLLYAADSDGDTLSDLVETTTYITNFGAAHYTSPLLADSDGDGLFDNEELAAHSSPLTADSDGDGMGDAWEIQFGFNPNDPSDSTGDADGDGVSNVREYQNGTSPVARDSNGDDRADSEDFLMTGAATNSAVGLAVTDHGGADWLINAPATITGRHINIGSFQVASNVTVTVPTNSVGRLWVEARNIFVRGTIQADGAGWPGASTAGAGGSRGRIVRNGVGGALVLTNRGTAGARGLAAPASGDFNSATNGGYGGIAGNVQNANLTFPTNVTIRSGVQGNHNEAVGANYGGYTSPGRNADTTTDYTLKRGGGGGSGGGGGGAETLDVTTNTNNLYYAATGGKGGAGQRGGAGGGAVWLFATHTNLVSGAVTARGTQPGGSLQNGTEVLYGPGAGALYTSGQKPGHRGGAGGTGGSGAGGGILLRGRRVEISGYMQVTGGPVAGTIKLFGQSFVTNSAGLSFGRLHVGTVPDLDSDADSIPDSQEAANGTDPLSMDTDGDEVSDADEITALTSPLIADTDADGMDDGFEKAYSLDARNSADASLDSDGDGRTNLQEYQAGTNPKDPDDGTIPALRPVLH